MRLDPAEAPALPLAACLCDPAGAEVAATPEWRGPSPGTLAYHTGYGQLLVAPDAAAPELDGLMDLLLAELAAAAAAMGGDGGRRAQVLAAGLALTSGRPASKLGAGTAAEVLGLAVAAIPGRTQGLRVSLEDCPPDLPAPAPAVLALALVQFAVNAQQHEGASEVVLRVAPGPTFYVEWPSRRARPARPASHRHVARRQRWGWGYVQMAADALGGSALPPGPTRPGYTGASLGLGAPRLNLPLVCVQDAQIVRATLAWDQVAPDPSWLRSLVAEAKAAPGQIVYRDLYRARAAASGAWVALGPESGAARARDLLRGLAHEQALWTAPEPHATRVHALATLLSGALGDGLPEVPPSVWEEVMPETPAALALPDPRLAAYLLAETSGRLVTVGDRVCLDVPPSARAHPVLAGLRPRAGGRFELSG